MQDQDTSHKQPSLATLHRRAEKGWRHRDIERSWTQFLWILILTAQTMMLGIVAVVVSVAPANVSWIAITVMCVLTIAVIVLLVYRSVVRRNMHAARAEYFEQSVAVEEVGGHFDGTQRDAAYKKADETYRRRAKYWEVAAVAFLVGTIVCLLSLILNVRANVDGKQNDRNANHKSGEVQDNVHSNGPPMPAPS